MEGGCDGDNISQQGGGGGGGWVDGWVGEPLGRFWGNPAGRTAPTCLYDTEQERSRQT